MSLVNISLSVLDSFAASSPGSYQLNGLTNAQDSIVKALEVSDREAKITRAVMAVGIVISIIFLIFIFWRIFTGQILVG